MALLGAKSLAFLAVFVLALAVFVNYPASTKVSKHLAKWEKTAANTKIINGHRIFYKDEIGSKSTGPVLLLLHGFPSASYDWIKVWPALLEKFGRVIAPDFLGLGLSDKPLNHQYSIMEQADITERLMESLQVTEAHILAHDYGDTVAQELLARFEDRESALKDGLIITSVCLLNGGIFPETNFPRLMQKALLIPYLEPILSRLSNIYMFSKGFGEVFGPKSQPTPEEFEDFWALVRKNDGHLVLGKLLQYIPERSANKHRWTGVLKITSVPVHVIYGPADPVNPPGFVDFYKKTVPNPSVSVLHGYVGHYPQWEDPSGCMVEYFKFLKTLPYPARTQQKAAVNMERMTKPGAGKPVTGHSTATSKYKKINKDAMPAPTQQRDGERLVPPQSAGSEVPSEETVNGKQSKENRNQNVDVKKRETVATTDEEKVVKTPHGDSQAAKEQSDNVRQQSEGQGAAEANLDGQPPAGKLKVDKQRTKPGETTPPSTVAAKSRAPASDNKEQTQSKSEQKPKQKEFVADSKPQKPKRTEPERHASEDDNISKDTGIN